MTPIKLLCLFATVALALTGQRAAAASGPWEQPAAALADQIAAILGPGQAQLTIRNLSKISADDEAAVRRLLEQDLKARGVQASGTESANAIRITLSENLRERLWVAEVVEGSETRVAMVQLDAGAPEQQASAGGVTLRMQTLLATTEPVLAALEIAENYVVIEPEEIVIYARSAGRWQEQSRVGIGQKVPLVRDPHGVIFPTLDGQGFVASVAGMACSGSYQQAASPADWTVHCRQSDDPWLLALPQAVDTHSTSNEDTRVTPIRAFYNGARNYFTGVLSPGTSQDLPPFYMDAVIAHSGHAALLVAAIDGKVQLLDTGALKPVSGTRDWGSDFAALHSGCGAGTQIIASGSGEALTDSLRAYEIPAHEAIPTSAPLTVDGAVIALSTAPDGNSVLAVVRELGAPNQADVYEVDRVTASCN